MLLVLSIALVGVGLVAGWGSLPRTMQRDLSSILLNSCMVAYPLALSAAILGAILSPWLWSRAKRPGVTPELKADRKKLALRTLSMSLAMLLGAAAAEAAGTAWQAWKHRMPHLPSKLVPSGNNRLHFVMIGESTAQTEPYGGDRATLSTRYSPWFSIPQLIGAELQANQPGLNVSVELITEGGIPLEVAHQGLASIRRKPDAVFVYSGHNEFQARFQWARAAAEWSDHPLGRWARGLASLSPVVRTIRETLDKAGLNVMPTKDDRRALIDVPTCSQAEYDALVDDFTRRLEAIASDCDRVGAIPIFFVPAANDAGFEPTRSVLDRSATPQQREALTADFQNARKAESNDPDRAEELYRGIVARHPEFAEAHFRLGQRLEAKRQFEQANREYALARDLDGMPLRCPSPFQDAYRRVAARHPRCILIESADVLRSLTQRSVLDDTLFHDAHHPTFRGYVALAQAALDSIARRGDLGWPKDRPAPRIDPAQVARTYQLNPERWATVCAKSAMFYRKIAPIRHDSTERLARAWIYEQAEKAIDGGTAPENAGVPGLGVDPQGLVPFKTDLSGTHQ